MTKRPLNSIEELKKKIRTGYENIFRHDEEKRKDKQLVLDAVRFDASLCVCAVDKSHWGDKEIMLEVVKFNGLYLQKCSLDLQKDRDVVLAAVTQNPQA